MRPPRQEYVAYCVYLGICLFDTGYIERALQTVDVTLLPLKLRWQSLLDTGLALYDLGKREQGILFLEQAATLSLNYQQEIGGNSYVALWLLSSRLHERKYSDKRIHYANNSDDRWTVNANAKTALAAKYINDKMFDEAKTVIEELAVSDPAYSFLVADFYYAQRDFQTASDIYAKYRPPATMDFLFAHFDYKRASTYYLTGQETKWKQEAQRIGRRLAWDRFYTLEYLDSEGVERIPRIDEYISSVRPRRLLLDLDRMWFYLRRLPRIAWTTFLWYRYHIIVGMFLLGFVLTAVVLLLKLFFGQPAVPSTAV